MFLNIIRKNSWLLFSLLSIATSCNKDDNSSEPIDDDTPISGFTGAIEWIKNYGGSLEDDVVSIVETPDGGFVLAGFTMSLDGDITDKTTNDADYWIFKINASNQLVWSKTYGGSADDRATKIINTSEGGFAVLGYSRSNDGDVTENSGFYDYWLLKLDNSGNLQWNKCYGFEGHDQGNTLMQTADGGYLLAGFIDYDYYIPLAPFNKNSRHGVGEYWAVKTDNSGDVEWEQYYGGTNNDRAFGVVQTNDGGYLMVGNSESDDFDITHPKGSYDYWAVKINSVGEMQWQKNYGGSGIEIAYGIIKTNDSNYLIIGDSRSSDQDVTNPKGNADIWLLKITDNGTLLWQKSYGGSQFDTSRTILEKDDNNLIIIGSSRSSDVDLTDNYGESDFWLVITDPSGNITFQKNYGGSNLDFGNTGLLSSSGNIILAGSSQSNDGDVQNNKGSKDVLIIKLEK